MCSDTTRSEANRADLAIEVHQLSKAYQIYKQPSDRLKQFIWPRLNRLFGRARPPYYRNFWALHDVSFSVKKGETVGIIGRNGSGKSTLLQMICGTLTPSSGHTQVAGRVAALLELGSGFNPEFTGRENVYLNATVLGLSREQIDVRFEKIVAFAEIGEFIDQPVKTYSSGMYVRLAFAVIAHVDADILVIDEALAVGDVFFTQKCMRFLRDFMSQGTVLFVSHDTAAVKSMCDRVIWLDHGKLILEGSPKLLTDAYLRAYYEQMDAEQAQALASSFKEASATLAPENPLESIPLKKRRDRRMDWIQASNLRNDLEIFEFDPQAASFGNGGGQITSVELLDESDQALAWTIGGEAVKLQVRFLAIKNISQPIVGFYIKDRLGQQLFGDNTHISYQDQPVAVQAGQQALACFEFEMPILMKGEYTICVALADGTQQEHVQLHWIYDALALTSHASSVSAGLMGIRMDHISLAVQAHEK